MACNNTALQLLGYGTIDPVNKTSTTHSAITDQAGLSHINTGNFKQEEVQSELNEIITSDFNKGQVLTELGAQVNITTEFGKEAPRRVGDYAEDKRLELLAQGNIEEAKKWADGGVYRVTLHTAVGALGTGTGTVEGAVTTGGVAAAAPIINKLSEQITEHLLKAGISEDTAQNATSLITSLAIATVTQSAGVNTTSTAMAVNADAFNRQLHKQEKELARVLVGLARKKELKRPDGKSYTLQDIEDALRWANSGMYGETYNSNRTVHIGNKATQQAIDKVMYDGGVGGNYNAKLWLSSQNGNITTFTQNLNNIKKPDANLTKFIQEQAPSYKYSWGAGTSVDVPPAATQTPPKATSAQRRAPIYPERAIENQRRATINSGTNLSGAKTTRSYLQDSVGKYGDSVVNTTLSGVNGEIELGGTAVVGLGVRQTTGIVFDTDGKICTTHTTCALAGPMVGGYAHAGVSGSTGTATPGSRTWQLTGVGAVALGTGYGFGGSVNSDGSITGSVEGTIGGALGGAVMICSKKVGDNCVD